MGFAAETEQVEQYAKRKLAEKNLDLICANDVSVAGQGFNSEQNAITLYGKDLTQQLALQDKSALATSLIQLIVEQYHHEKKH